MRIHTDAITELEARKAARLAGVGFTRFGLHGSRSRDHAFDVLLTGSSTRRQNTRGATDDMAATWDEWGIWLGTLFDLDPAATIPGVYESAEHFHWATGGRYKAGNLRPSTAHANHKWEWSGVSMGGNYSVSECQCGAIRRWAYGSWSDFQAATA